MRVLLEKLHRAYDQSRIIARKDGLSSAYYCLFYDFMNKITPFSVYKVMELTPQGFDPSFLKDPSTYHYGFLNEDQIRHYAGDPDNDMSDRFVEEALENGEDCFAVLDRGTLASYGWYTSKPAHVRNETYFFFEETSYKYMHKGFTHPDYRGQRLHAMGMAKACEKYVESGHRGLISLVEAHNLNSLRSVYRLGYQDIGNIYIAMIHEKNRSIRDLQSRKCGCCFAPMTKGAGRSYLKGSSEAHPRAV